MQKRRDVTHYFLAVLWIFFLPSGSSLKASPVLTKPVSTWHLDNGSAEAHTCSRLDLPFDFHLPFLMRSMTFGLPYSTASDADSFTSVCCWEMQGWSQIRYTLSCWTLGSLVNYRERIALQRLALILYLPHLYLDLRILSIAYNVGISFSFHLPRTVFKSHKVCWHTMIVFPSLCSLKRQSDHMLCLRFRHLSNSFIITYHDNALITLTRQLYIAAAVLAALQSKDGNSRA